MSVDPVVTPESNPAQPKAETWSVEDFSKAAEEAIKPEGAPAPKADEKVEPKPEAKAQDGAAKPSEDLTKVPSDPPKFEPQQTVPKERFDEVNSKLTRANEKIQKFEAAKKAELDRVAKLSDEEKEAYEEQKKLSAVTKESQIDDQIEALKEQIEDLDAAKKALEVSVEQDRVATLKTRIGQLSTAFDGKNGLPKFEISELLEFAKTEGYFPADPYKLYSMKYAAEIFASKQRAPANPAPVKGNNDAGSPTLPAKKKNPDFKSNDFDDEVKELLEKMPH